MKFEKSHYNENHYKLWSLELELPESKWSHIFYVVAFFNEKDPNSFFKLKVRADSVKDALERTCFLLCLNQPYKPEDVNLLAAFDESDKLLWVDENYYSRLPSQGDFKKKYNRREFVSLFGNISAFLLLSLHSPLSQAGGFIPFSFF